MRNKKGIERSEAYVADYRTLLYPDCKQGQKKLGTTLELMQWKASNGLSDKGFEELLKLEPLQVPGLPVLHPMDVQLQADLQAAIFFLKLD